MPSIHSISCDKNMLKIVDRKSTHIFDASKIPVDKDSIAKLENYINTQWIPSLEITDYQLEVHIFSVSPLSLTAYTANIGEKIPTDWWLPPIQ